MTKKELDSITEQDLDFLTSFIIPGPCLIEIEQVPKLLDICHSLRERFGTRADADIDEVRGYYYVDAEFGNMEVIGTGGIEIEDSRPLIKYLKEHGSGKYDERMDDLIEEQEEDERLGWRSPYRIDVEFNFEEIDAEQLPSFLYFGKEDEDGYIEVKSIRDDDIYCYYNSVSKSYYNQP